MRNFAYRKTNEVKPVGWQLWKILSGSSPVRDPAEVKHCTVCLLQPPGRSPQTHIEAELIAVLTDEGTISLNELVQRVADRLYHEELRRGAGALDIGLFGSGLFDREVVAALEAGSGVLWELSSGRQ
jgi:hypothetical protein